MLAISTLSLLLASMLGFAANRASSGMQIIELAGYTWLAGLPGQAMQIDLRKFQSFSQYDPAVLSPQAGNYGENACGLIAPAQAVVAARDPALVGTPKGFDAVLKLMDQIRTKAIRPDGRPAYQGATGIQPSDLLRAVKASPIGGQWQLTARNGWTLSEMYQALQEGRIVIVDIQVQQQNEVPSTTPETFAHYARVLGMDIGRQQIFIENTLGQQDGKFYWILSFADFMAVWAYPETRATIQPTQFDPSIHVENVTRWALVLSKK